MTDKKHILLIHQVFRRACEGGGTRHYELLQRATEAGHSATVVASRVGYLDGKSNSGPAQTEDDGIRIRYAAMLSNIHRSFFHRLMAFLSFMCSSVLEGLRAGKIDVVVGTTPPLFQALAAWCVSLLRWKPFILEVRDLWPDFAIEMGILKNPFFIWLGRRLECFLYRCAKHIIVNSPAFIEYLVDTRGIRREKITLVPNGVDVAMFDPAERGQAIRNAWGVGDRFTVVYAGALGPANDIPTIIRAAERLQANDSVRFVLVGDGKDRERSMNLVREKNLHNVIWAGVVSKTEMKNVLAAADACLAILMNIPMFRTVYPNKVFDYMAAGRPTILGIDGVIRDVVEASDGGVFFTPGDDKALAGIVSDMAGNRESCTRMGSNARAYVAEHFNRDVHSEMLLDVIQRSISA
jgi:glycosyltransferase involved in cell wall biosynthesis